MWIFLQHTVDGSEIHRNHQLRLVVEIPLCTEFFYVPGGISEPSTASLSCKVLAPMLTALIRQDAPGRGIDRYDKNFKRWQDVRIAARLEIMENGAL